jgi:hypothetical protein
MPPPISWLNWRELAALNGTEGWDGDAFMRPVAGIEPIKKRNLNFSRQIVEI